MNCRSLFEISYEMKDLQKEESLEAVNARLKKEHEKLQTNYQVTCAINEMWRQKCKEMEQRKNELLRLKAEREGEQKEHTLNKDAQ